MSATTPRSLIIYARRRIEELAFGRGWDVEYPRDTWRLRNLGISDPIAHVRFGGIPQLWLKDLAKRWCRWRLATGLSAGLPARGARVLAHFGTWLAGQDENAGIEAITRPLLERYLAALHAEFGGRKLQREHIENLNGFLTAVRQHEWDPGLPAGAMIFPEDYPKRGERLPRALAEHVMAQIEDPASLGRWADPGRRLITLILIRCGLRIGDACKLPSDCIVRDGDGQPYLRYYNHKMKREALVPVDDELVAEIGRQEERNAGRWPGGTPVLFPRPTKNIDGTVPANGDAYRGGLRRWLASCDIRGQDGSPIRLTPHQFRHSLGTTLINRDVPQHVVQKILDHETPEMTAHYARLTDTTVRRHWEAARKVNTRGETVSIDPAGPLAEAAWAKQQLSRATQALPNGYCQLPVVKTCPHANSCLTCPMFLTTAEFLPQHHAQRQQTLQIISAAEANGHARLAEMNRQVAGNLDNIIAALEADGGERRRRQPPVRPDPLSEAAARRHELTRAKAVQALRELDRAGTPVTFAGVAQAAGISRSWLYTQPDISGQIRRLRQETNAAGSAGAIPAGQRATDASLRARLTAALDRNKQLADENARLRRQLARALGDQRSARTRSGNDQGH